MANPLDRYSRRITQPESQDASRAQLYATDFTDEDFDQAQVGVPSVWYEGNNCNVHLVDLAARVKDGVEAAGLKGMRFNTVGLTDGMSMGTEGTSFSLQLVHACHRRREQRALGGPERRGHGQPPERLDDAGVQEDPRHAAQVQRDGEDGGVTDE